MMTLSLVAVLTVAKLESCFFLGGGLNYQYTCVRQYQQIEFSCLNSAASSPLSHPQSFLAASELATCDNTEGETPVNHGQHGESGSLRFSGCTVWTEARLKWTSRTLGKSYSDHLTNAIKTKDFLCIYLHIVAFQQF